MNGRRRSEAYHPYCESDKKNGMVIESLAKSFKKHQKSERLELLETTGGFVVSDLSKPQIRLIVDRQYENKLFLN